MTCLVYYALAHSIRIDAEAAVVARDSERLAAVRAEASGILSEAAGAGR
ncbi:MAG TPA: hypothetical protein VIH37_03925 [Candidatus Limnocylindrales bacterium]